MTSDKANELATEIADYCFAPAFSEATVVRLAMMTADGRDLGGLSKEQFRTRIAAILAKHAEPAEPTATTQQAEPNREFVVHTRNGPMRISASSQEQANRLAVQDGYDLAKPEPVKANDKPNGYLTPIRITHGPDAGKTFVADIYDIVESIGYRNLAQAQAAKKILRGGRADKDWQTDMEEAADSIKRAIEREGGK